MSSRTAGSLRAIRGAWEHEQRLVLEGKGTRDWTDEQQKQINDKGKAYDDEGRAFEGQHMKSFSAYPEYRDDPRNIQLLSREEHFAAHGGNWMNQTNGYYHPVLRTMSDFGDGPPQPCAEVPLTNPLFAERPADKQTTGAKTKTGTTAANTVPTPTGNLRGWTQALQRVAQQAWNDQRVRAAAVSVGLGIAKVAMDAATGDRPPRGARTAAPSTQPSSRLTSGPDTDSLLGARQPPNEHGVSGYTRKNGTNVRSYQRGGKKD